MGVSGFVTLLIPLMQRFRGKNTDQNKKASTIGTNTTTIQSDSLT